MFLVRCCTACNIGITHCCQQHKRFKNDLIHKSDVGSISLWRPLWGTASSILLACFCYYLSHVVMLLWHQVFPCPCSRGGIEGWRQWTNWHPKSLLQNKWNWTEQDWSKAKEHFGIGLGESLGCEWIVDRCMTFLGATRDTKITAVCWEDKPW